ncbi:MAG: ribonuclease D [Propionibacteriaceae bacterium]|nr:ribonuclease D [Propionibacteriaceae bacterium]
MTQDEPRLFVAPVVDLITTDEGLEALVSVLTDDPGPVAIDTERASGYRYEQRAYLIQLKTIAAGTHLIDPVEISASAFADLDTVLKDKEWILHAANQDLPSLRMSGLHPQYLFDTEVSARLLGREKVGLGFLVEDLLGVTLVKEHANSDWSQRPIPEAWLSYAAGDVEFLIQLADLLKVELAQAGKTAWAQEEFSYTLTAPPPVPRPEPWRSTTDIHLVTNVYGMAVVRALWEVRERIGKDLDLAPGRIVNSRAITALAATATKNDFARGRRMLSRSDWGSKIARNHIEEFYDAIDEVEDMDDDELPAMKGPRRGVPAPGLWPRKNPEAAARWEAVRPAMKELAEDHGLPVENLISPRPLQTVMWEPQGFDPESLDRQFAEVDVRPWQRQLIVPVISALLAELNQ